MYGCTLVLLPTSRCAIGVHSHDPLGSKDGIWGDDH